MTRFGVNKFLHSLIVRHYEDREAYELNFICTPKSILGYIFSLSDRLNTLGVVAFVNTMMDKQIHQFRIDVIIAAAELYLLE